MTKVNTLAIGLFTTLISCVNPKPTIIEFYGYSFQLPIKAIDAKEKLGLQYEQYAGFYKKIGANKVIETQLKNYPLFLGSDNDFEDRYYKKYIVGITFFLEDVTMEQLIKDFEEQYKKKFITKNSWLDPNKMSSPSYKEYHHIKTDENLYVVLRESIRNIDNKGIVTVSFYKGILDNELNTYLEYVE
jgi:hypothetical protein